MLLYTWSLGGSVSLPSGLTLTGPPGDDVDELADDRDGLFHFLQSHEIARVDVAGGHHRDFEVDGRGALAVPVVFEAEVRLVLAHVPPHPAGAGHRAGQTPGDRFIAAHGPDALGAVDEDAVLVQQLFHVLHRLGQRVVDELVDHPLEHRLVGQVHVEPPHPRPGGMEALAGHELDDVVDRLALVEAVQEGGEGAKIQAGGSDAKQVRLDAPQFTGDGAQHLAARRELDAHQPLRSAVPGEFVVDGAGVVHAVDDGDVLVVIKMFTQFLEAGVEVADVRRAAEDAFTVELEDESQGGVGGGVLGPKLRVQRLPPSPSGPAEKGIRSLEASERV